MVSAGIRSSATDGRGRGPAAQLRCPGCRLVTAQLPPSVRARRRLRSACAVCRPIALTAARQARSGRSEEHTSELQSLMRISYAVFCLEKKKHTNHTQSNYYINTETLTNSIRHIQTL